MESRTSQHNFSAQMICPRDDQDSDSNRTGQDLIRKTLQDAVERHAPFGFIGLEVFHDPNDSVPNGSVEASELVTSLPQYPMNEFLKHKLQYSIGLLKMLANCNHQSSSVPVRILNHHHVGQEQQLTKVLKYFSDITIVANQNDQDDQDDDHNHWNDRIQASMELVQQVEKAMTNPKSNSVIFYVSSQAMQLSDVLLDCCVLGSECIQKDQLIPHIQFSFAAAHKLQTIQLFLTCLELHAHCKDFEIEKPVPGPIEKWTPKPISEFCKSLDQKSIMDLILISNYMNTKKLLDLFCAMIALIIRGQSPEQIRQTFGITNDFTPEEEEQVRRENQWCEEM